jgi:CheY-like chemotaxis protein
MTTERTILIAEDSDTDLQSLLYSISTAGVQNHIQIVSDGQSAINYLQGTGVYQDRTRHPVPSILILDLNLPMRDGFEVLNHIGEHLLGSKILKIVLTGYMVRRLIDKAYGMGANSFLHKPVRAADLSPSVATGACVNT